MLPACCACQPAVPASLAAWLHSAWLHSHPASQLCALPACAHTQPSSPSFALPQTFTFSVFEGYLKAVRDLQRTQQVAGLEGVAEASIRDYASIRTMSNNLQQQIAVHRKE